MEDQNEPKTAIFAGGCFWCMQPAFDTLPGVLDTTVGYTGGETAHPTYEQVSSGRSGHVEAIRIVYDPAKVSYRGLLDVFWRNIDPTQPGGQFADLGPQYRTVVFYADEEERHAAERSKAELESKNIFVRPIVTEILPAREFYPAEEGHQKFYQKDPGHYTRYKTGSGRAGFLRRFWG